MYVPKPTADMLQIKAFIERGPKVWKTSFLFKKLVMICGLDELALARKHESRPGATRAFFPPHQKRLRLGLKT